ncbi:hypothetical protein [Pseudaestuariivita atlantica]|uniref:Uncharacterized protein n=1 Tax=Pseudaestuariivita atlantica TaxID=1317121 RepID=A0A0L1JSF7_9RHOB|nr:hypothetical protein [Pseudaestuariivita atlantica]KNG94690.1 hypothetical protein ATO11_04665 [Pseudaestuariivita atlantica]
MDDLRGIRPRPAPELGNCREWRFDTGLEEWLTAHVRYWRCEECVVLPKVAVNAMRSVANWRRGPRVVDAVIPPGTPIGTFMHRDGRPADRWDGGEGLGAPGNDTTHSAVLAGYLMDAYGGVLGLKVWELYPGCGMRARRRIYPLDDSRFGSRNARNYHVICEPDGRPLGGRDNPVHAMWPAGRNDAASAGDAGREMGLSWRDTEEACHDPVSPPT